MSEIVILFGIGYPPSYCLIIATKSLGNLILSSSSTSLISIFANVGISLGSFTASTTVNFANLTMLGYVGAVYGLLAIGLSFALRRFYRK